jgi:hypothetical protein
MFVPQTGFGAAAVCPSVQQMLGIVDATDPCQVSAPSVATCAPGSTPIGGTCYDPTNPNTVLSAGGSCPAGSTCTIVAGVPDLAVYTLGGLVGLFILMGVLHK